MSAAGQCMAAETVAYFADVMDENLSRKGYSRAPRWKLEHTLPKTKTVYVCRSELAQGVVRNCRHVVCVR